MITIVDYGIGNLGSIRNMFRRIGASAQVTSDLEEIGSATKLLLPGVGAFDNAMARINEGGLREVLDRKAGEGVPILGICLGMQLLTSGSEEGQLPGLGWIPGRAHRLPASPRLKVPHMGWNLVRTARRSPLTADLPPDARFYFVHSFAVQVHDRGDSLLRATHGVEFDAAIQRGNIYGAQFHPEKSHRFGMQLLSNFAQI
ncbi:glutamine amidotransferase [Sphingomonas naasensis]|uniref:Imidazole glycerol phosphate synthase subunit HisH n=1 Tax=Sphingomonas naasensis TaxID=1344951 RepID=A0A4S1WTP8_9SPHN|nr:imidazole glycerol phosphate synthase subunit HisH [Sphingomonas naasensis]NIJ19298.1 glutamine amidotransferase [Sphingomonas naasensis]TGX46473.1 imidazole glycerol phosphate synthase subunit HisH [Sphingomonas naasensis]